MRMRVKMRMFMVFVSLLCGGDCTWGGLQVGCYDFVSLLFSFPDCSFFPTDFLER